jgi:hypothetical protein
MQKNTVDLDLTIELAANASAEIIDRKVRTVIVAVHDNAQGQLTQSELVRVIKSIPGVANVQLPFRRMAKSDGSYDIGHIIPSNTTWDDISLFVKANPSWTTRTFGPRTFITRNPVLRYKTIPSGGLPDAYVGLLYEGESYRRCKTLAELQTAPDAAFYIIGVNDKLDKFTSIEARHYGKVLMVTPAPTIYHPQPIPNPGMLAYRVTYQVFGEAGSNDIIVSPTEYLVPGKVTIDYVLGNTLR